MAFLDEVAALLAASTASSTAWPIFRGHMPDSTVLDDRAIALVHTASNPTPARIELQDDRLDVYVRGRPMNQTSTAYQECEAKAVEVKNALRRYSGAAASNSVHYEGIWCDSAPYFDGFDAEWRPAFAISFRCVRSR